MTIEINIKLEKTTPVAAITLASEFLTAFHAACGEAAVTASATFGEPPKPRGRPAKAATETAGAASSPTTTSGPVQTQAATALDTTVSAAPAAPPPPSYYTDEQLRAFLAPHLDTYRAQLSQLIVGLNVKALSEIPGPARAKFVEDAGKVVGVSLVPTGAPSIPTAVGF